jgi:hypothetical protein
MSGSSSLHLLLRHIVSDGPLLLVVALVPDLQEVDGAVVDLALEVLVTQVVRPLLVLELLLLLVVYFHVQLTLSVAIMPAYQAEYYEELQRCDHSRHHEPPILPPQEIILVFA